jgi:hypothetical protein
MAVEAEAESALSEDARAALREFGEKHREVIENADLLPHPMRTIAEFVKKEGGWKGEGKEDA